MGYTVPTLGSARTALAQRLSDPTMIRWVRAELDGYLREALRTWNAWTASARDRAVFTTTLGQAFYDLPTVIPTLRGQTLTDRTLITDLEYALLEPPTSIWSPETWTGSAQFAMTDLVQAVERRRNQFLLETGAVLTHQVIDSASPPVNRVSLPEAVCVVRRAAWIDADHFITPLQRTDEWALDAYQSGWPQEPDAPPLAYSVGVTPPLQLQIAPPAVDAGSVDLLTVNTGATLDPTTAVLLGVPDDFAWVIKFGALADLLSRDGLALDLGRAAYCEARWQQGIQTAKTASVILSGRINNVPVQVGSISDADSYSPTWQSVPSEPVGLLSAGHTALAIWPPPGVAIGGGEWSITLDVVRNMPVPSTDAAVLQISPEVYDGILDYSQHLALFKEGAQQLQQAQGLLDRFARICGVTVGIQQASQPDRAQLTGQTQQDTNAVPLMETP